MGLGTEPGQQPRIAALPFFFSSDADGRRTRQGFPSARHVRPLTEPQLARLRKTPPRNKGTQSKPSYGSVVGKPLPRIFCQPESMRTSEVVPSPGLQKNDSLEARPGSALNQWGGRLLEAQEVDMAAGVAGDDQLETIRPGATRGRAVAGEGGDAVAVGHSVRGLDFFSSCADSATLSGAPLSSIPRSLLMWHGR